MRTVGFDVDGATIAPPLRTDTSKTPARSR
ncbi:Uncharacterised protein [Mycobacteroides abscessus subsp. abscessus]|nr:Uncharacterised protein [Mycobacteroides abscessus subsp. abscessus]